MTLSSLLHVKDVIFVVVFSMNASTRGGSRNIQYHNTPRFVQFDSVDVAT